MKISESDLIQQVMNQTDDPELKYLYKNYSFTQLENSKVNKNKKNIIIEDI